MSVARPKIIEYQQKNLTGQVINAIQHELKSGQVKQLKLIRCSISEDNFKKLAAHIERNRASLEEIDLTGTKIGNFGSFIIGNIAQKSPALTKLNLSNNNITTSMMDYFDQMLKLKPLKLILQGNPLMTEFKKDLAQYEVEFPQLFDSLGFPKLITPEMKNQPQVIAKTAEDEIPAIVKTIVNNAIQKALNSLDSKSPTSDSLLASQGFYAQPRPAELDDPEGYVIVDDPWNPSPMSESNSPRV